MAKCCKIFVGAFCLADGVTVVYGFATLENGEQTTLYYGLDGTAYVFADLEADSCEPVITDTFDVAFIFNNDYICAPPNGMVGTAEITISDTGGILDNSIFLLHFDVVGVQLISTDPNVVVDDINVTEFRIVDASLLTSPITLTLRIPNVDCDPIVVNGEVTSITPLFGGWVIGTNTPGILNYP